MVSVAGFEPTTLWSQTRCSSLTELHRDKTGGSGEIRTHGPISESTVFKTVPINRTLAHFHNFLVLPLGIEPSSMALQTTAMTTSAKAALTLAGDIRIELITLESKSSVIPFHQSPSELPNKKPRFFRSGFCV